MDLVSAPTLIQIIDTALTTPPRVLLIDLTDVDFLASIGLAALLHAYHRAPKSTTVAVIADGPVTSRPITITGIDEAIALYSTRQSALHALGD